MISYNFAITAAQTIPVNYVVSSDKQADARTTIMVENVDVLSFFMIRTTVDKSDQNSELSQYQHQFRGCTTNRGA